MAHISKQKNVYAWFALLLFCLVLLPNIGFAADVVSSNGATTGTESSDSSGDISIFILQTLFGGMFIFGGGTDGLQDVFYIFNTGLWLLAGVFMTYVLATVLLASRSGEVGGRSFNVFLMTARTAFGVTMIVPTANGYALIQVLTMWLILQGVALSDAIWGKFASSDTLAKSVSISPATPNAKALTKDVLIASLCMAAVQAEADYRGDYSIKMGWSYGSGDNWRDLDFSKRGSNAANGMLAEMVKNNPDTDIVLRAGSLTGSASMAPNACGEITIKAFNTMATSQQAAWANTDTGIAAMNTTSGALLAWQGDGMLAKGTGAALAISSVVDGAVSGFKSQRSWNEWLSVMAQEHANSTQTLLARSDEIAENIILSSLNAEARENQQKFGGGDIEQYKKRGINLEVRPTTLTDAQIVATIDGMASDYINEFRKKAVQTYQGGRTLENFLKQANEYGWWMAGYAVIQMANLNDAANQIALNVPDSSSKFTAPNSQVAMDFNSKYMSRANQYLELSQTFKNDGFRLPTVNRSIQDSIQNDAAHQSSGGSLSMLLEDAMISAVNTSISDHEHPIIQLKRLGSVMIAAGTTIFTIMTIKFDGSKSGALVLLSMFAWSLMAVLFMGGITLNYVLPMLPAIIWTGMLVGWLFMVMELMVIMPMWALTNVSLHSGEDFVGAQKIGYTMLLTMVLRAPLMTIGVIMMTVLMNVFGIFINSFYTLIYSMSQINSSGMANIFLAMFIAPMMYASLVYITTKEILTLMYKIPDNTLSIFGGGGQSLGSYGEKLSGGSVAVFGQVNNAAIQPLTGARSALNEHRNQLHTGKSLDGDMKERQKQTSGKFLEAMNSASVGSQEYGGFGGINNSLLSSTQTDSVIGKINDGRLGSDHDNEFTFKAAKDTMLPAESGVKTRAIDKALQKADDHYAQHNKPMSYQDFFKEVNGNINQEVFGVEQAQNLQRHADMLDIVNGNNEAGNGFMQGFHEKMHGIADREGVSPSSFAGQYAEEFNNSMQSYANNNGLNLHPTDDNVVSDFNVGSMSAVPEVRKAAEYMNNVSRSYITGHGGLPATSPAFDRVVFDPNSNQIRKRNTHFGYVLGTSGGSAAGAGTGSNPNISSSSGSVSSSSVVKPTPSFSSNVSAAYPSGASFVNNSSDLPIGTGSTGGNAQLKSGSQFIAPTNPAAFINQSSNNAPVDLAAHGFNVQNHVPMPPRNNPLPTNNTVFVPQAPINSTGMGTTQMMSGNNEAPDVFVPHGEIPMPNTNMAATIPQNNIEPVSVNIPSNVDSYGYSGEVNSGNINMAQEPASVNIPTPISVESNSNVSSNYASSSGSGNNATERMNITSQTQTAPVNPVINNMNANVGVPNVDDEVTTMIKQHGRVNIPNSEPNNFTLNVENLQDD